MFAQCLGANDDDVDKAWDQTFSWLGSTNNPPDFMIKKGDAVEVKITETIGDLQLNSSAPKRTLKSSDVRITDQCRACEVWSEKDFGYCIGLARKGQKKHVNALWLIDGSCISDSDQKYAGLAEAIKTSLSHLGGVASKELSRFNKLDAQGLASLRVRGMWLLPHPAKVFRWLFLPEENGYFVLNALVPAAKWAELSVLQKTELELLKSKGVSVSTVEIPNPESAADTSHATHISWKLAVTSPRQS